MNWTEHVDGYCERLDPSLWAEPINAITNFAFLIAAALMWSRTGGLPLARAMCVVLFLIGLGSLAFHTFAQVWAGLADVLPILGFILLYFFAANRDYLGLRTWPALGVTALFVPYSALTVPLFSQIPWLGGSSAYVPVPILIVLYAVLLWRRDPAVARGLLLGAGILVVSLTARTVDEPLCAMLPLGTHFLWHVLNALMLGWMIEVYRRHRLAGQGAGG